MKKYILATVMSAVALTGFGQTATNFTCNDCAGVSHDLFSELDAGKVIVLDWVMPCGACAGPSVTAYNMVQSYQTSHPGRVFFYMADDYANTICATLNGWANGIGVPANSFSARFSNASINMMDYGSTGMPKIVVLGGTNHTVFYNVNNSVNATALQNAIDAALSSTGVDEQGGVFASLSVHPNPADKSGEIKFSLPQPAQVTIELFNLQGKKVQDVFSGKLSGGAHQVTVTTSDLARGMYLLKLNSGNKNRYLNIVVSH